MQDLATAYDILSEKIAGGTATTENFQKVVDLTASVSKTGISGLDEFSGAFAKLQDFVSKSRDELATWQKEAAGALAARYPSPGSYDGVLRSADFSIRGNGIILPDIGPTPDGRPLDLARDPAKTASQILNGDGRFTAIPTPSARPNYFEWRISRPSCWLATANA